jgi:hypothetical protein
MITILASVAWPQEKIRLKTGARPAAVRPGARHFLLQFRVYPDAPVRRELALRGGRILGYLPDNGLVVSTGAPPDWRRFDVTAVATLETSDKLSP